MGTSVEDLWIFMIVSSWNISDKFVEKNKAHVLFKINFSRKSCLLWDPVEKYVRPRQARRQYNSRTCFACRKTKVTNKHSEYVILIAFPGQKLLFEMASLYLYIVCLVQFVCRRTISTLVHVKRIVGTCMILVILLRWPLSLMILSLLCEILLRLHVIRFIFWWHIDTQTVCLPAKPSEIQWHQSQPHMYYLQKFTFICIRGHRAI